MWNEIKWAVAACVAALLGLLAWVYGKKTPAVLRAKVRAHNARGRALDAEIRRREIDTERRKTDEEKRAARERVATLRRERETLEIARTELLQNAHREGMLSDADLARAHNAGSGH